MFGVPEKEKEGGAKKKYSKNTMAHKTPKFDKKIDLWNKKWNIP